MSNDYTEYPDHPLFGINPDILRVAREEMEGAVECNDVYPDMAEPIADMIVAALRTNGYLKED